MIEVGHDVLEAIRQRNEVAERIQVLREQQTKIENRIHGLLAEDLGSTTATLRYGTSIVRIKDVQWKHTIGAEGQKLLAELLEKDSRLIRRLFNMNSPSRWAEMKSILDDYYDGGWETFNKEFVDWEEKPAASSVSFIPEDKAPKFALKLADGEAVIR